MSLVLQSIAVLCWEVCPLSECPILEVSLYDDLLFLFLPAMLSLVNVNARSVNCNMGAGHVYQLATSVQIYIIIRLHAHGTVTN